MSKPEDHQELDDLALRVLHGIADESEQAALRELLRTKPDARHRFVLQATQHVEHEATFDRTLGYDALTLKLTAV